MRARTLDELAALTGVSRATVSRVINGGPVAPATRARVLDMIERVDYRPNLVARSLASGRTGVVGLVMHVPASALFTDSYFSLLLQGITGTLSDEATGLMLWLSDRSKHETLDQILSTRFVDGVIATATVVDDPLVDGLLASDLPTVLIGHRRLDDNASYVDIDDVSASEAVVDHLLEVGSRRIGHITGERGTVSGEERLVGFHRALDRANIAERFVVDGDYTSDGGHAGALRLLEMGVDAIYAASDHTAEGVYRALAGSGLRIPQDIRVAGFDDLESAASMDPPLTTVRQNVRSQGEMAARTLLRLLGRPDEGPRRVLLPTELVIRRSTIGEVAGNT
jgi:DNA-binding LacI/PurR family transcriptional regulator